MTRSRSIREILGRPPVHPFPARMAPEIAFDVIADCSPSVGVLDPMCGSGTVLAVAQARGHRAIGFDLDPLAVLTSRVWTTPLQPDELRARAASVLRDARNCLRAVEASDGYPAGSDSETRRFLDYWFDGNARRQLRALTSAVEEVQESSLREALWCAFSRLIITKQAGASRARDLAHSRPHRSFSTAPVEPFDGFPLAVECVARGCVERSGAAVHATDVEEGDARRLPLKDGSIGLVLTSPPYLNAIDYFRCSKFSLVWMGHSVGELRRTRSVAVGTEVGKYVGVDQHLRAVLAKLELQPRLRRRQEAILVRYIDDIRRVIGEVARVLAAGGRAVFVVGENTLRGAFIRNSRIVEAVASVEGLRPVERRSRELPPNRRYLPPPSAQGGQEGLGARMRREVVLTFEKAA